MSWRTNLAAVARRTGHPVHEVRGWQTRGHGDQPAVRGIVCHHTGGRNDLHVVVQGRPDLRGPLSHFWLARTGAIYVVAAGRCWHNAPSTDPDFANSAALGIEAENRGDGESWPSVQLDAYARLCAELCREFGLSANRVKGHREVNAGKNDPRGIDMADWRRRVAALMKGDQMDPDEITDAVWQNDGHVDNPHVEERDRNPKVRAGWVLTDLHVQNQQIMARLDDLGTRLDRIVAMLDAERPTCPPEDGRTS